MKNETLEKYKKEKEILWQDRKRFWGQPITFTTYKMTDDRLFVRRGLISDVENELLLYRITDVTVAHSLWQKMCGVGSVIVNSTDSTTPVLIIKNVKDADVVKEMIHDYVEKAKKAVGMHLGEILR